MLIDFFRHMNSKSKEVFGKFIYYMESVHMAK